MFPFYDGLSECTDSVCGCIGPVSLLEAMRICDSFGARMCTVDEMSVGCASSNQCNFKSQTWTSEECTPVATDCIGSWDGCDSNSCTVGVFHVSSYEFDGGAPCEFVHGATHVCPSTECELTPALGYTSFEEVEIIAGVNQAPYYFDKDAGDTNHTLRDNPLENPVSYAACTGGGAELGFHTYYISTTGATGATDGDGASCRYTAAFSCHTAVVSSCHCCHHEPPKCCHCLLM